VTNRLPPPVATRKRVPKPRTSVQKAWVLATPSAYTLVRRPRSRDVLPRAARVRSRAASTRAAWRSRPRRRPPGL
jgi:hypothetical protein